MAVSSSGYVGVAPVNDDQLHIAAAVDPRALAVARSPGSLTAHLLKEAGLPSPEGIETANWRGTPMLTQQTRPLGGHRFLRVGDAAGYVEPFTGEGIGWAMQSAVLISSLLEEDIDCWDAGLVRRWQRWYQEILLRRHRRCHAVTRLLRSKTIRQFAVWSLRRAPSLAMPLVRRIDQPIAALL
jgi:flavin-dependent dehydrogenase